MDTILKALMDIESEKVSRKKWRMEYQPEDKVIAANGMNLPTFSFFGLPYIQWVDVRKYVTIF